MQLFYTQSPSENSCELTGDEVRHCFVLRKKTGDILHITDGQGHLITGRIENIQKDLVTCSVVNREFRNTVRKYYLHLLISPIKRMESMEWMFEKAVELGIDEITFVNSTHSEKFRVNTGRLKRIAISALKQSNQFRLPVINDVVEIRQAITNCREEFKFLAACADGEKEKLGNLKNVLKEDPEIAIFIGPEGDFSPVETALAVQHKFKLLDLGENRLRTETAGLYCVMAMKALFA